MTAVTASCWTTGRNVSVCRVDGEPGRRETLCRMRGHVCTEVQPGQILSGLRCADAPEERGRTAAEKIPAVYAFKVIKVHGNQGFGEAVAGVTVQFYQIPTKQTSKCVEIYKTGQRASILAPDRFCIISCKHIALLSPRIDFWTLVW